jgi:16S rRNA (guanine527-N7)-methyltransferase
LIRLEIYERVLLHWQKSMNLVAKSTLTEIWTRHFADSAQLLQVVKATGVEPRAWLDLGSGGGLPGLVIAIMLAETATLSAPVRVVLIESDARKCAFLREVLRQVGLSRNPMPSIPMTGPGLGMRSVPQHKGGITVDILPARIENLENRSKVGAVDVISARALAPLPTLLSLSAPFFGAATVAVFQKGRDFEAEVDSAKVLWNFEMSLTASLTDPEARVLEIRKVTLKV